MTGGHAPRLRELMRVRRAVRAIAARGIPPPKEAEMAKSQKKSNREARKPKAEKPKKIAANASTKDKPVGIVTIKG